MRLSASLLALLQKTPESGESPWLLGAENLIPSLDTVKRRVVG